VGVASIAVAFWSIRGEKTVKFGHKKVGHG